ncbi:ATP-binding protein [Zhongshania guokunii]|uniref:histidine kinase n=1 Tax=Zhongshania guokunii TaxID=641783 RepID=A0ABV3U2S5_9GAMM
MSFTRRLTFSFVAILLLSLGSVLIQIWGNDTRRRNVWLLQHVIRTQSELNDFSQRMYSTHRKILVVDALSDSGVQNRITAQERQELLSTIDALMALEAELNGDLQEYLEAGRYQYLEAKILLSQWRRFLEEGGTLDSSFVLREYEALSGRISANEWFLLTRSDEINVGLRNVVSMTNKVALGVFLLALITTFILGYYMTRYTRRSIRQLQKGTAEWGSGNFDYSIGDMGHDEFGQLAHSFDDMAANLREAMARVREASRRADAANQAKSGFMANMSHELRTPMNAIIGYSEMLIEEIDDEPEVSAKDLRPDLAKIQLAGKHLLTLINDVLDISKIESGRMAVYWEDVALESILRDVEVTMAPLMAKNGNTLHCHFELQSELIRTDVTRLRQILLNLLSNAAKFTREGEVSLRVSEQQIAGQSYLIAEVKDSGIGMSAEQLGRVFDAFVQADLSTTKQYGGSGLGLTISRKFAELLGGSISAESEPGVGSRFELKLPLGTQELGLRTEFDGVAIGDVLVIDDDPAALDLCSRTLSKAGYRVHLADSGAEGLRMAQQRRPDVVLLDVMMPGMDGWQVLHNLRTDPSLFDVPVLMLSMLNERDLSLLLGANEYLVKPVDSATLTAVVHELLPATAVGNLLLLEQGDSLAKAIALLPGAEYWQIYRCSEVAEVTTLLKDLPLQLIVMGPHSDKAAVADLLAYLSKDYGRKVPIMLAQTEAEIQSLSDQLGAYLRRA